jgi:hypothetical protein
MALDDDFAGGSTGYYNPQFGLMAIQQPEMFVQHLARNGIKPPEDFPDDFTHEDAHQKLGAALKDQNRAPGMGEAPGLPQQGSFDERFSDALKGAPGTQTRSFLDAETGQNSEMPSTLQRFPPTQGLDMPPKPIEAPKAESPGPKGTYDEPSRHPIIRFFRGQGSLPGSRAAEEEQRAFGGARRSGGTSEKPLPTVATTPTPAPEAPAAAGGTAEPAGGQEEKPGDLSTPDPSKKTAVASEKKMPREDSIDSFGKALAGLTALKPPTPVFPHPGAIPHPGSQISRSTVPTEILKELSAIGHPGSLVRLGAALKGR